MKSRSAALDAIRVLAIIAVVGSHVWNDPIAKQLFLTWNVPIFFFLSGYLWTEKRPMQVELQKRFTTLVVPYVSWLCILLPSFLAGEALSGSLSLASLVRPLLGGAYIGQPFSAFWFVSALFFVAISYRALQRFAFRTRAIIAVMITGLATMTPEAFAALPLGIGTGLASLVFIVAGDAFRLYRSRLSRKPLLLGITLITVGAAAVALGLAQPLDLKHSDFGTPVLSALVSCLLCLGATIIAEVLVPAESSRLGRSIVFLSSCGLFVVLGHSAVLALFSVRGDGDALIFGLAVTVPWLIGSALRFTALSPILMGVPRLTSSSKREHGTKRERVEKEPSLDPSDEGADGR